MYMGRTILELRAAGQVKHREGIASLSEGSQMNGTKEKEGNESKIMCANQRGRRGRSVICNSLFTGDRINLLTALKLCSISSQDLTHILTADIYEYYSEMAVKSRKKKISYVFLKHRADDHQ